MWRLQKNCGVIWATADKEALMGYNARRFEKNCLRLVDTLGAPKCIGEVDPRT
jgi:hypothetical protein